MDGHYIEPRTILWAAAEVSWQDAAGSSFRVPATLEDTSPSGACLRVQRPFTIGSRIVIKWHREQFSAVARNCRSDGHGFLLGVRREPKEEPYLEASEQPISALIRETTRHPLAVEAQPSLSPATTGRGEPGSSEHAARHMQSRTAEPLRLRTRRLRPLPDPVLPNPRAEFQNPGSSPRPERKAMPPKTLFPHFWRRQQDTDAPAKTFSTEAPVNKPSSTVNEPPSEPPSALLSYEDIYPPPAS